MCASSSKLELWLSVIAVSLYRKPSWRWDKLCIFFKSSLTLHMLEGVAVFPLATDLAKY